MLRCHSPKLLNKAVLPVGADGRQWFLQGDETVIHRVKSEQLSVIVSHSRLFDKGQRCSCFEIEFGKGPKQPSYVLFPAVVRMHRISSRTKKARIDSQRRPLQHAAHVPHNLVGRLINTSVPVQAFRTSDTHTASSLPNRRISSRSISSVGTPRVSQVL